MDATPFGLERREVQRARAAYKLLEAWSDAEYWAGILEDLGFDSEAQAFLRRSLELSRGLVIQTEAEFKRMGVRPEGA